MAETKSIRQLREMASAAERLLAAGDNDATRLAAALHRRFFQRSHLQSRGAPAPATDRVAGWRHLAALSAAHGRRRVWQAGFRLTELGPDLAAASRGGVTYFTHPRLVRGPAGPLEVGQEVALRVPGELRHFVPEYFFVLAGDPPPAAEPPVLLRLYWNLTPAGAADWLAGLAARLDPAGIRWQAQALRDPAGYGRADAAVLYLDPRDWLAARRPLRELRQSLEGELAPEVPFLTRQLAPGLGLAEGGEPARGYGEESCRRVADAVEAGPGDPWPRVLAGFRAAGRDPRRPYLAPGSTRVYSLPAAARRCRRPRAAAADPPPAFTAAALAIGRDLRRQAHFFGGRCNWVAPCPPGQLGAEPGELALSSLGPGLEDGLAGIALFFAELHLATGDAEVADTGRAAARQALRQLGEDPGGAWDAARALRLAGAALGDGELVAGAEREIGRLSATGGAAAGGRALVAGEAGSIEALLDLHRQLGAAAFLLAARRRCEADLSRAAEIGSLFLRLDGHRGIATFGGLDLAAPSEPPAY